MGVGKERAFSAFSFSPLAGLQTDPEAGKHYSAEEGESMVGETHQAGEAPTVFGP